MKNIRDTKEFLKNFVSLVSFVVRLFSSAPLPPSDCPDERIKYWVKYFNSTYLSIY